jgi:acyl-CoA synthetase (AMP-forming)/AMP-acid ligase II
MKRRLLYEHLVVAVDKVPNKTALIVDGQCYTYNELFTLVKEQVPVLQSLCRTDSSPVALVLNNSITFVATVYALSCIEITPFLVNPEFTSEYMLKLLNNSRVNCIIIENQLFDNHVLKEFEEMYTTYQVDRDLSCKCYKRKVPISPIFHNEDSYVLLQTTSGTTNIPKISFRSAENVANDLFSIRDTCGYCENDTIYCAVPLFHGYGLTMGLLSSIYNRATLITGKWFMVNRCYTYLEKNSCSIFIGSPKNFKIINEYHSCMNYYKTRYIFSSGSALTDEISENFNLKYGRWINQMYGMMEASTISINLDPNENNHSSVGKPVIGVEIQLRNQGELSFIEVRSRSMSEYYLSSQGLVRMEKVDSWFSNGDIGKMDSDGNFYLLGRTISEEKSI